jgi:hypothetical protein
MSRRNRCNNLHTSDKPHVSFRLRRNKGSLFARTGVLKPASHTLVYTERKKTVILLDEKEIGEEQLQNKR